MGWTGAGEHTVKHWLAGLHGPRGDHLFVLMQESDAVFEAVLTAINRRDVAIAARMLAAQRSLQEVADLMQPGEVRRHWPTKQLAAARAPSAPEDRMTVKMTAIVTVIMTVKAPKRVLDPDFGRAGFWRYFERDATSARPTSRSDGASLKRRRGEMSPF
jgi:hypothetical protein